MGAKDYIWVEDVDDRDTTTALTRLTCLALRAAADRRAIILKRGKKPKKG